MTTLTVSIRLLNCVGIDPSWVRPRPTRIFVSQSEMSSRLVFGRYTGPAITDLPVGSVVATATVASARLDRGRPNRKPASDPVVAAASARRQPAANARGDEARSARRTIPAPSASVVTKIQPRLTADCSGDPT